jgi:DNA mismatch repair protein MutL
MSIRLLPDIVIDQIAAGEVVERPAAVVKELVENSLDAQSRRIQVFLEEGGNELVRVVDDGSGMDRDDARMCLQRHATSKIRSIEDLVRVRSFGFRGEAIPSIASVSRFELLTRRADDAVGTRLEVEGGVLRDVRDAGCAVGTDIKVREIFYNTPVRRGFLRTASTELGHCVEAVVREALIHPQVDVQILHNGREHLRLPAVSDLSRRVGSVLVGGDALLDVTWEQHGVQVRGWVGPSSLHQGSTKDIYLYVNGRYVRDPLLRRGVRDAYQGLLPTGRHPVLMLHVTVPDEDVDVNVHPSKVEVRFRHPKDVADAVAGAIRRGLQAQPPRLPGLEHRFDDRPATRPMGTTPSLPAHPEDDPSLRGRSPAVPDWLMGLDPVPPMVHEGVDNGLSPLRSEVGRAISSDVPNRASPRVPSVDIISVIAPSFALASVDEKWFVVDLGSVRRVLVLRSLRSGGDPQRLLLPKVVRLTRAQVAGLAERAAEFEPFGLSVGTFSPVEIAIKRVPKLLGDVDWSVLLPRLATLDAGDEERVALLARHASLPYVDEMVARAWISELGDEAFERPHAVTLTAERLGGLFP